MDINKISYKKKQPNNKTKPVSDDKDVIIVPIQGKIKFGLSPVSQVNFLDPFRLTHEKNNTFFNPIMVKKDIIGTEDNLLIYQNGELNEGELLYIPSYFFKQFYYETNVEYVIYEFKSNSRILDSLFKVLFDDDNRESEI
jgi:hypothetical protein